VRVQSLLLPLFIFAFVALWGVAETGRKFRREFRKRGKSWGEIEQLMAEGEGGMLIVDTLWGPQRGLGHPVVWFSARRVAAPEEIGREIESGAFLVKCPKGYCSAEALRERFGAERVVLHSWRIDTALAESAQR
jgi:hypothetical protein